MREITSGVGILSRSSPVGWVASRVAGDAMDLGLLGAALTSKKAKAGKIAAAAAAVAGVSVLDLMCSRKLVAEGDKGIHIVKSIIIDRTRTEFTTLYRPRPSG